MKLIASRANCSSLSYIRRQIFVAAAISGSDSPNASTVSQPSKPTSLSVSNVVFQGIPPVPGVPRSFSEMCTCTM